MTAIAAPARDLGLPGIYIHLLAELLRERGLDERRLLQQVGLDPHRILSTDVRVPLMTASEFVRRALLASDEPGLGILLAKELRMPLHGALGVAVMSSRNLEDALRISSRYMQLRLPQMSVVPHQEGDQVLIRFTPAIDLGPLTSFMLDTMTIGFLMMGEQLLGQPIAEAAIHRRGNEPRYYRRFLSQLPSPVLFQQNDDAVCIPASWLRAPVRFSDDLAAKVSREQCEQALRQLTGDASVTTRVQRVIETSHPFPPRLQKVASTLFMSERTLKRRLQEESTTFQQQVDSVRLERAGDLLVSTRLSLAQIADALGYADAANFTRAFKRWTGISPSRYRVRAEKSDAVRA
ncbi:AraC family transcriptional regulator [Mangrovitalea sediminis]|uniref:AraC family transcriptional regulator n=1 Tax=Mangrovitalea sediminis TaxID=1982043 RepID=UPI000BE5EA13|nr:AraC family transcriptional regulator [Mangrovitalea sediminis]